MCHRHRVTDADPIAEWIEEPAEEPEESESIEAEIEERAVIPTPSDD